MQKRDAPLKRPPLKARLLAYRNVITAVLGLSVVALGTWVTFHQPPQQGVALYPGAWQKLLPHSPRLIYTDFKITTAPSLRSQEAEAR